MKACMLKVHRQDAGLGDPPSDNAANTRIKKKVDFKKSELNIFCNQMKELVEQQYRNVERAFTLNTGPYEVSPEYVSNREDTVLYVVRMNIDY